MARWVRIVGWLLYTVSLLAALYGVFGGPDANNLSWFAICVVAWIVAQVVLALARRLARAEARREEVDEENLHS